MLIEPINHYDMPGYLLNTSQQAAEIIADRAIALPPLNLVLARELVARTRVSALLQGYRGRPPAALDAVHAALLGLAQLAADQDDILELDINPLLADQRGVIALDAQIGRAHV